MPREPKHEEAVMQARGPEAANLETAAGAGAGTEEQQPKEQTVLDALEVPVTPWEESQERTRTA